MSQDSNLTVRRRKDDQRRVRLKHLVVRAAVYECALLEIPDAPDRNAQTNRHTTAKKNVSCQDGLQRDSQASRPVGAQALAILLDGSFIFATSPSIQAMSKPTEKTGVAKQGKGDRRMRR